MLLGGGEVDLDVAIAGDDGGWGEVERGFCLLMEELGERSSLGSGLAGRK